MDSGYAGPNEGRLVLWRLALDDPDHSVEWEEDRLTVDFPVKVVAELVDRVETDKGFLFEVDDLREIQVNELGAVVVL